MNSTFWLQNSGNIAKIHISNQIELLNDFSTINETWIYARYSSETVRKIPHLPHFGASHETDLSKI